MVDEKMAEHMRQDMQEAIGFTPLPEHAVRIQELQEISGMKYEATRKAVNKLVESGEWKRQRYGNATYFWKVIGG